MTDYIKLSDSNLSDFPADASRGDRTHRRTVRRSDGSRRPDIAGARALEPVVQSALGIVRESTSLLYHIAGLGAGLGIALVSDPKLSRPKCHGAHAHNRARKRERQPVPRSETSGHRPTLQQEGIMTIMSDANARTVDMLRLATAFA